VHVLRQLAAAAAVSKDKIKSAIEYYQTQNNATLKQSMVYVGFNLPQTDDSSPAFIDFACWRSKQKVVVYLN